MIELETVRHGAGWFRLPGRGVVEVRGEDRIRFLNGQLSQDIEALEGIGVGAGGYAFLLTPKGRIVADLWVLLRDESVWLECERVRIPAVIERLDRFLVADDVALQDRSDEWSRFAVEGPGAEALLAEVEPLAPGHCAALEIEGVASVAAAFGFSGLPARQLFAPSERGDDVEAALLQRGLRHSMVPAPHDVLETLRVEAGLPGSAELDEDVLPAETGVLERAVSFSKGCYTGQEVVARMASRDRMAHRLVGLAPASGGAALRVGETLFAGDRKVGEVSSAALSSRFGPIALGFVRVAHSDAGTGLTREESRGSVTVRSLPFGAEPDAPQAETSA